MVQMEQTNQIAGLQIVREFASESPAEGQVTMKRILDQLLGTPLAVEATASTMIPYTATTIADDLERNG